MGRIADIASHENYNKTIESAIEAFIELGADDTKIYELLHKYFNLDSFEDMMLYTAFARINSQYKKLREYKIKLGMAPLEFGRYCRENDFAEKLENEPKLRTLSPDKLAAALEKKQ